MSVNTHTVGTVGHSVRMSDICGRCSDRRLNCSVRRVGARLVTNVRCSARHWSHAQLDELGVGDPLNNKRRAPKGESRTDSTRAALWARHVLRTPELP